MSEETRINIQVDAKVRGMAHVYQSDSYPKHWEGHVPVRVRMTKTVRPDLPFLDMLPKVVADALLDPGDRDIVCEEGREIDVCCNSHGAVYVVFPNGVQLGLKPDEFYVVAWVKPEGVKREGAV